MSIDKFLSLFLEQQERQTKAMEQMAENAVLTRTLLEQQVANQVAGLVVGELATSTAETARDLTQVLPVENAVAGEKVLQAAAEAQAAEQRARELEAANEHARKTAAAAQAAAAEKKEDTKKAPSVDDCRAALKTYAAANGNAAAMALLSKLGAASVSALEESKRQELIDACK